MPDVIIADTSCLILLTKIGELHLLQKLYDSVSITPVIAREYGFGIPEWVSIKSPGDNTLAINLDPGEASAINLALSFQDSLLIIDDAKARAVATRLQLTYTGTIGVILEAKNAGMIDSVKAVLQKIRATNFYISEELEQKALKLACEL